MGKTKSEVFYETKKFLIETDRYNFIIRKKPIVNKSVLIDGVMVKMGLFHGASYITDKNNLLWELCDCRKFFTRDSEEAKTVTDLLKHVKFG